MNYRQIIISVLGEQSKGVQWDKRVMHDAKIAIPESHWSLGMRTPSKPKTHTMDEKMKYHMTRGKTKDVREKLINCNLTWRKISAIGGKVRNNNSDPKNWPAYTLPQLTALGE